MLNIHRTPSADRDLDAITQSIAIDNPLAAHQWLEKIDQTLTLAATFPLIGELVPDYGDGVRRITEGSYVIFFKPIGDRLEVLRVLHGSRDIERLDD